MWVSRLKALIVNKKERRKKKPHTNAQFSDTREKKREREKMGTH